MCINIHLFIKSFVSIQNDERKTSCHHCYFTDARKSSLRDKVNSIYNEKLFTLNHYKFTDKTVKNNSHDHFKVESLH